MAGYELAGNSVRAADLAAAQRDADQLARFEGNPSAVLYQYDVAAIIDGLEGKLDRTAELRATRSGRRDLLATIYESYNWFSHREQTPWLANSLGRPRATFAHWLLWPGQMGAIPL
jgi:hypothetical protein